MDLPMCRLCLTPNSGTEPLFDERTTKPNVLLLQKVVECTSIKLTWEEDYPSSICGDCAAKIHEWSTFKIQCIVNNDFYRRKQADVRRQLIANKPPIEIVCLDDDDDDDENDGAGGGKTDSTVRNRSQPAVEPPQKKAKIVEPVIIDDDEDAGTNPITISGGTNNGVASTSIGLYYDDNDEQAELEAYEDNLLLEDYELVEGQEEGDQSLEQEEDEFQTYQMQQQPELANTAILSSILLDDDSNNSLLTDFVQPYFGEGQQLQCTLCDRRYTSATQLRAHMKCHTENKKKCFICGKMIVVHLIRHLRSQHPGQSFPEPVRCWHNKCAHSSQVFQDVDQLLEHMDNKRR